MSLYEDLLVAKKEADVEDAYIRALKLPYGSYKKHNDFVDIQTPTMWFEAKLGCDKTTYQIFTQACYYLYQAMKKGDSLPAFLCAIDSKKAALLPTKALLPLLQRKGETIPWAKNASADMPLAVEALSQTIGVHHTNYLIETQEKDFIQAALCAMKTQKIPRKQITPNNLKDVFDIWVESVGRELACNKTVVINGECIEMGSSVKGSDLCLLFYADVMSDDKGNATHENLSAELLHKAGKPCFILHFLNGGAVEYNLKNSSGYKNFWATYARPPLAEYRDYLLERRDCLIELDTRAFRGEYYTPLALVSKAYELLDSLLGKAWQQEYITYDPCCGVGNLETKHSNLRNVFMSTLVQSDLDIMTASATARSATRFLYDYLNDDIADTEFEGVFDYKSGKMPQELQKIIKEHKQGKQKVLILMNPPYAEATNANNTAKKVGEAKNKAGVAKTKVASFMGQDWGKATNELFSQFMARISWEFPDCVLAIFSTLKYINSTNFEKFRKKWNASFLGGFVVHSKAFDGLKGDFPIGFLVWQTHNKKDAPFTPITSVSCSALETVFDKKTKELSLVTIGEKRFYNLPVCTYLNVWLKRPKANKMQVVPLSNAITPTPGKVRVSTWSDGAIAYMYCGVNDLQHAGQQTVLFSSTYGGGNGFYVTPDNLLQASVVFTVRRIVAHTWLNDRDQFLQPKRELERQFMFDCLIYMLFSGSNLTAGACGLLWKQKQWTLINHFVPYTEDECKAFGKIESNFMASFLRNKRLSKEARLVLEEGKKLWQAFFSYTDSYKVREALKLGRSDAGWYQVRNALKSREKNPDTPRKALGDFASFNAAYSSLTEKLLPQVFDYGFMK